MLYPVRIEKRKNIEEAVLVTKILNKSGEGYRLVVTLPFLEDYKIRLKQLAEKYEIPCSLGEAGKFIGFDKTKGFTIAELFSISDLAVSTSVREGFGFAFIEPWISGTPLIGRKIQSVTEDFENSGMILDSLYDNDPLPVRENFEERIKLIEKILSNPELLEKISKQVNLHELAKKASLSIENNATKARENYSYASVAKKFMTYLDLPVCPLIN